MQTFSKKILLTGSILLLTACNGFFEKDNTPPPSPLASFKPEVKASQIWSTKAGKSEGDDTLKMSPSVVNNTVFTSSVNGLVSAIQADTGQAIWQIYTDLPISSGPAAGDGIVVVGTRKGDILALNQATGQTVWKTKIADEIIAKPTFSHGNVIIKAVDGHVRALSSSHGQSMWSYQQTEPNLILRGSSSPVVNNSGLIIGFANGNLVKLNASNGQFLWQQSVAVPEGAFAIERMIDIDADPLAYEQRIYAATYQGNIAALDNSTGSVLWSHDISSYTGMAADSNTIYVSDAKGYVWAFDAYSGLVRWRQLNLEHRVLSAPAIMGNYVVVGDAEGYLHWINKQNGQFSAREYAGAAIYATPIVKNNVLYAFTKTGFLSAYKLS